MSPNSCWLWSLPSSSKSTWPRRLPGLARAVHGRRKSVNKCYDNHDIHYHFNPDHFYHPTTMIIMAIGHLGFDREVIRLRRVTKDGSCWLLGGTPLIIRIITIPWKITNGFYLQTFGKALVGGDGVVVSLVYLVLNWWCLVYLVYLVLNWWCYHSGHSMNYDEDTSTEFVLEAWCPPAVYRCWSKRIMMLSVI